MSRYFARLAQRSGFAAPRVSTPAPMGDADIIEQQSYTEGSVPAGPTASTVGSSSLQSPAPVVAATTTSDAVLTPVVTHTLAPMEAKRPRSPEVSNGAADNIVERSAQRVWVSAAPVTAPSSAAADNHKPRATVPTTARATERSPSPIPAEPAAVKAGKASTPTIIERMRRLEFTAQASAAPLPHAEPASPMAKHAAAHEAPAARDKSSRVPAQSVHDTLLEVFERVSSPFTADAVLHAAPGKTQTPNLAKPDTAESPSESQNIEVRIGAVRLDVHAPPAPVTVTSAPAPGPTNESPRFSLRRYHLRG